MSAKPAQDPRPAPPPRPAAPPARPAAGFRSTPIRPSAKRAGEPRPAASFQLTPGPKRFVAVAGNIGVGKSTLTQMLAGELGWEPFMEAVDDNPYLADFYQDMSRWGFHSQMFFLGRRLQHHHRILEHPTTVVQDRCVYEDAEIFARNLFRQGHLSRREWDSYRSLYEVISQYLPPPDLVVYLRAGVETVMARIRRRGRDYERQISPRYIGQLHELYEEWARSFRLCPVLTVPADEMDFVSRPEDFGQIVVEILEALRAGQLPLL